MPPTFILAKETNVAADGCVRKVHVLLQKISQGLKNTKNSLVDVGYWVRQRTYYSDTRPWIEIPQIIILRQ